MKELNANEIQSVNGGCAEMCWGDFDGGALLADGAGGAIAGLGGGLIGVVGGSAGGMIGYLFQVMWAD